MDYICVMLRKWDKYVAPYQDEFADTLDQKFPAILGPLDGIALPAKIEYHQLLMTRLHIVTPSVILTSSPPSWFSKI
jgi:hypothetical protein